MRNANILAKWRAMMARCYSERYQKNKPSYVGCSVCQEWLEYENFEAWVMTQKWEGKELDKDLLFIGNKIYSPDTCCFISKKINGFIRDGGHKNGFMMGVSYDSRRLKYRVNCRNENGKAVWHGYFETEESAAKKWIDEKRKVALILSRDCEPKVAAALIDRYTVAN